MQYGFIPDLLSVLQAEGETEVLVPGDSERQHMASCDRQGGIAYKLKQIEWAVRTVACQLKPSEWVLSGIACQPGQIERAVSAIPHQPEQIL